MNGTSRSDRGSVTIWTLGMALVVMFVGAISLGLWSGFAERRELAGAADQAAQAGANALDEGHFRTTGDRRLDPDLAEALAAESLSGQQLAGLSAVIIAADAQQVVVELTADVDTGLLRIFGDGDPLVVHVRAVGQPREDNP